MVKISSVTKVRIILSVTLWIAGAVILLGGTALSFKSENAWSTIFITGVVVMAGIFSAIKRDRLAMLKPQLIRKD